MRLRSLLFAILLFSVPAFSHVGSPDVYYQGNAGPYHLLVTIRPPVVVRREETEPIVAVEQGSGRRRRKPQLG